MNVTEDIDKMEQKDLDFIKKFEEIKSKQGLRTIGIVFFIALACCPIYIFLDVVFENGTVEVTLSYLLKKFSFGFLLSSLICFISYNGMRRKYKKLKKEGE